MATNLKQTLALDIARSKQTADAAALDYKELTTSLATLVGDAGETFATDLGDVQVTQRTSDRIGDDLVVSFNKDKFLQLDRRAQNRLINSGLVTIDRKVVAGQAPRVVVRLNK